MKGIDWPENESLGSYAAPVEDWIAMVTHLGTLALIPDHSSQVSVAARRVRQDDGPSLIREVSSAYCRRLVLLGEQARSLGQGNSW